MSQMYSRESCDFTKGVSLFADQTRANIPRPNFSDIRGSQYEENRLPPNRKCRNPDEPSTSRETAFYQNVADDVEEMDLNESKYK